MAPALLLLLQLKRSAFHSVCVGKRKPLGHGLFIPFKPCHKLSFLRFRQSQGLSDGDVIIYKACPGASVVDRGVVVAEVLF